MDLIGVQLAKYRIIEKISSGGMSQVFKAYQADLDRYVAIKMIAADLAVDKAFRQQFELEAKTLAKLEHPHILPIYDYGYYEDTPYLVMQYVSGGTLAHRLGKRIPVVEAIHIIKQLGSALGYAHAKGVIHRDIKPSNVLFTKSNQLLLSDFGLAQAGNSATVMGGTPAYMAPEQKRHQPIDARVDIYAIGVLLAEMITGKRLTAFNKYTISGPLGDIIRYATDENVNYRYETIEYFLQDIEQALLKLEKKPYKRGQEGEFQIIIILVLIGVGIGSQTIISFFFHFYQSLPDLLAWMTLSATSLSLAGILIFRDRTRPISRKLMTAMSLLVMGAFTLIFFGLSNLYWRNPYILLGISIILSAMCLYIYERRQWQPLTLKTMMPMRQARFIINDHLDYFKMRAILRSYVKGIGILLLANIIPFGVAYIAGEKTAIGFISFLVGISTFTTTLFFIALTIITYGFTQLVYAVESNYEQIPTQLSLGVTTRQAQLKKAYQYQTRIKTAIANLHKGPLSDHLQQITPQVDDWVARLEKLIHRLTQLEQDSLLQRDLTTVPRAVHALEERLSAETNVAGDMAIYQTLTARQKQLQHLRALERVMSQAELYAEETMASLGSVYTQLLLATTQQVQQQHIQEVQTQIEEQINALQDLLDAMNEVTRL